MPVSAHGRARRVGHAPDDRADRLADFEAELCERTRVPMQREFELAAMAPRELAEQAQSVRCLIDRIASVVSAAHADPGVARGFLERLDLKLVSRDHDWRAVFRGLLDAPPGTERFHLAALARYRQYLEARSELVERLLRQQEALQETAELEPVPRPSGGPKLVRLPARRPVLVPLSYRSELALWLGGHRFVVRDGFPPELQSPDGEHRWPLERRGLMVGRHPESDIVVDARLDQVSRAHAVVEWPGYTRIIVIDLSSGGTFVERTPRH